MVGGARAARRLRAFPPRGGAHGPCVRGAVYVMLWLQQHARHGHTWLLGRSRRRAWLRPDAQEWRLLAGLGVSQAFRVFRLLAQGLRGPTGARPHHIRGMHPRQCAGCAAPKSHTCGPPLARLGPVWLSAKPALATTATATAVGPLSSP